MLTVTSWTYLWSFNFCAQILGTIYYGKYYRLSDATSPNKTYTRKVIFSALLLCLPTPYTWCIVGFFNLFGLVSIGVEGFRVQGFVLGFMGLRFEYGKCYIHAICKSRQIVSRHQFPEGWFSPELSVNSCII